MARGVRVAIFYELPGILAEEARKIGIGQVNLDTQLRDGEQKGTNGVVDFWQSKTSSNLLVGSIRVRSVTKQLAGQSQARTSSGAEPDNSRLAQLS